MEAFDDPKIAGVACYLARPKTGGVKGGLGLAEDPSHASLSCHQTGPITLPAKLKAGEEVFDVSTSLVFKEQKVVRFLRREAQCAGLSDLQHQVGGWFVQERSERRPHHAVGLNPHHLSRDDGHYLL